MDQKDRDNRGRRTGYRKLAWVAAVLTIFPLFPMAVGSLFPSTRRFLGGVGVVVSSLVLFAGVVAVMAVMSGGAESDMTEEQIAYRATLAALPTPTPTPKHPVITDALEQTIVGLMMEELLVEDADIRQREDDITLVLVVSYAISPDYAKELADRFVRLTKTLSLDTPPGRMIGRGIYNYLVRVYYPNEEQLARGAKVAFSDRMSW